MTAAAKPQEAPPTAVAKVESPATPAQVLTGARMLRPIALPAQLIEQQNAMRDFVMQVLEKDKDYGVIPGTEKPTMLKPGAEKVSMGFGLSVQSEIVEREIDHARVVPWRKTRAIWEGAKGRRRRVGEEVQTGESLGLYRYVVRVNLIDEHGQVRGSGLGSCSTMESKYIDRPRDSENTALKMAFKRAHVAAVLTTLGLSEAFTQDVEDLPHLQERAEQPPEAMLMPFGKTKGTPLAEIESADLESAAKWAEGTGKFQDFRDAVAAVLKARAESAQVAANGPQTETIAAVEAAIAQLPVEQKDRALAKWAKGLTEGCTEEQAQGVLSKLLAAQEKAAPAASKRVPSPHAQAPDGLPGGPDDLPF